MIHFIKENKDNVLLRYLLPNIILFPFLVVFLLLVYHTDISSFVHLSKILIFCMSIYLISNAMNTRMLSSNLFLSSVSLFYGMINCIQVFPVVFASFFNLPIHSPGMSIRTYYLGRTGFIIAFVILVILYMHKKEWISMFILGWVIIFIAMCLWAFNLSPESALHFINSKSFLAYMIRIGDKFLMSLALIWGTYYLRKSVVKFPKSHHMIWYCFLGCALTMEAINLINFLPFGTTNNPFIYHIFKITTLYIFIIGQVDCCILRPFSNLYIHEYTNNARMHNALEELFRYSSYVSELEKTLEAKSSSIYELINIFPEPVLICHEDRILNANQAALTLLGYNNSHALQTLSILEYISDPSESLGLYVDKMREETLDPFYSEGTLTSITGQQYDIEYILTPTSLFDRHSTLCIIRDISAKKVSELTKRHLHEQEFKLAYLSDLSHDLKAPLNIIYSALQMQRKTDNLEEIHRYSDMMQQNTLKLLRMIVNLLDLNKASQNMLTLKPQVINIVDKFEELCNMSQSYIENHNLTYVFDTTIEERLIAIDPQIFERIMLNLISNAIKYTPEGGHLYFELTHTEDTISLHVKDTGIGIHTEVLPYIFDRFRTDTTPLSTTYSYDKSYGMGLSIVKELVTLLDGSITCHSTLGTGSEFIVTLPTPPITIVSELAATELSSINLRMEFYDI